MSNGNAPNTPLWLILFGGFLMGAATIGTIAGALWQGSIAAHASAVPIVGIILFLGVTMLGHYTLANTQNATTAIRSGLAAGFLGAYLTVLGFSLFTKEHFSTNLVEHLTWVVGAVVTFYFGSANFSEYLQAKGAGSSQGGNQS